MSGAAYLVAWLLLMIGLFWTLTTPKVRTPREDEWR